MLSSCKATWFLFIFRFSYTFLFFNSNLISIYLYFLKNIQWNLRFDLIKIRCFFHAYLYFLFIFIAQHYWTLETMISCSDTCISNLASTLSTDSFQATTCFVPRSYLFLLILRFFYLLLFACVYIETGWLSLFKVIYFNIFIKSTVKYFDINAIMMYSKF